MQAPHRALACAGTLTLLAGLVSTQSNVIPGTDVEMGFMDSLTFLDRSGSFPNGTNAFAMSTTSCNKGSVDVPWETADQGNPMQDDHPYIAFLVARESNGVIEQISDYSHVKHGFFALSNSQCDTCTLPGGPFGDGDILGVGCSDTYGVFNNGDNYWLGPASEIDPWLGMWDPFGSYFDTGDPDVGAPNNNNGLRSLTNQQVANFDPVGNRVRIEDADLNVAGARYYYQGYYVIRGEAEADRWNNIRARRFFPTWNGSSWDTSDGSPNQLDSVLELWQGATVTSATNGNDDGRVYVGVRVSGPVDGMYHYEYAVQNRDSHRKVGAFEVPVCEGARVENVSFRDIDSDGGNDWSSSVGSGAIRWETANNPIRWNSFYNFSFDSDAAPESSTVAYDPFDAGAGLNQVAVAGTQAPVGLYNVYAGSGCSFETTPSMVPVGSPPRGTLGNASFAMESSGYDPSAGVLALAGFIPADIPLGGGCNLYMGGTIDAGIIQLPLLAADGSGSVTIPLPIPNDPILEGLTVTVQTFSLRAAGGPFTGFYDMSDAVRARLGDNISGCP